MVAERIHEITGGQTMQKARIPSPIRRWMDHNVLVCINRKLFNQRITTSWLSSESRFTSTSPLITFEQEHGAGLAVRSQSAATESSLVHGIVPG